MLKLSTTSWFAALFFSLGSFVSCTPEPKETTKNNVISDTLKGVFFVLNEGLFNQNNTSLSRVDLALGTVSTDYFFGRNSRKLGDTGNDINKYGQQVWVAVNVSSTIEVFRAKTGISIKQIRLWLQNRPMQPRSIAFWEGRAYITCYSGHVAVIDTETFSVENTIPVGRYPEGIAISGSKGFVANSGGIDFPNYDSTVSVIDLLNQTEIQKINVGKNPGKVLSYGDKVWVVVRGNPTNNDRPKVLEIDANTKAVNTIDNGSQPNAIIAVYKGRLIRYVKETHGFTIRDLITGAVLVENHLVAVQTPYGLWADDSQNLFLVTDAVDYVTPGKLVISKLNSTNSSWVRLGVNPGSLVKL